MARPVTHPTVPDRPATDARSRARAVLRSQQEADARRSAAAPPGERAPMLVGRTAAVLLGLMGAWLVVSPWVVAYPFDASAQGAQLRQTIPGVLALCCGLRGALVGRSRVAAGVGVLAGVATIVSSLAYSYPYEPILWNQLLSGVVTVVVAAFTLAGGWNGATDPGEG